MKGNTEDLFVFAEGEEARAPLRADFDELHLCMKSGANKAAIVLIGSLIESVLYYYIDLTPEIKNSIESFEKRNIYLSDLLEWARKSGVIDDNLYRLADPIRDYRNLIHPRVQKRLEVQVSENLVQIGYNILLEIIRSINKHSDSLNGQRAEKVIARVLAQVTNRKPSQADLKIYKPLIEKYGVERGTLIIEKSLRFSGRRRKTNAK